MPGFRFGCAELGDELDKYRCRDSATPPMVANGTAENTIASKPATHSQASAIRGRCLSARFRQFRAFVDHTGGQHIVQLGTSLSRAVGGMRRRLLPGRESLGDVVHEGLHVASGLDKGKECDFPFGGNEVFEKPVVRVHGREVCGEELALTIKEVDDGVDA